MKKIGSKIGLVASGLIAFLAMSVAPAAASNADNPQAPLSPKSSAAAAAAPDLCQTWTQLRPAQGEQRYRNFNNVPYTYASSVYSTNWFNVACGSLTFTVSPGQEALVDLSASGELDCQGPTAGNSWCGSRFLINGLPLARPDNSGRSDTFAWDSANGGANDWQANINVMGYRAICSSTTACAYRVQLQSRMENSATSIWIDDLTMHVDVFEGKVTVVNGPTTP